MEFFKAITSDTALFVATCAMVASVVSSCLALISTIITLKHNRLSVVPMLTGSMGPNSAGAYRLTLENHGIGPAEILDVKLCIDSGSEGASPLENIADFSERIRSQGGVESGTFTTMSPGTILGAGSKSTLLSIDHGDVEWLRATYYQRITMEVVYKDAYKRRFKKIIGGGQESAGKKFLITRR